MDFRRMRYQKHIVTLAVSILVSVGCFGQALPNLKVTPGKSRAISTKTLCSTKWGKDERHVTAKMKRDVCEAYNAKNCPSRSWEIDHLISRELGGADVESNLWPQPLPEYHKKDRLENALHKQVCAGTITLKAAQQCLVKDWRVCYRKTFGESPK
jgi:hypothetical protein